MSSQAYADSLHTAVLKNINVRHTECICHLAKVQRISEGQFSFKVDVQAGTRRYRQILFLSFKNSVHAKKGAHHV